jgi:thiol-disulfide isomerase/thioredoxin
LLTTARNFLFQALIFFLIFQLASSFRESSMLATDTKLDASERLVFNKVPTTMGETVSLTSQNKKTVIYFFAPWCSVCHLSIGNLQSLYEKNPQLDVIAVALDFRDTKEVIDFTKEHQLTFPIALGNEQIKHAFSVSAYPSYYVINEHNSVIWKSMGYSSELGLYLRSL